MFKKRQLIASNTAFERLFGLSDGVFAIVITLMVIELKVPKITSHSEQDLQDALIHLLPVVAAVVISFFIVGMMWVEHHRTFRHINKYNMGLLWRNFIFLGCVSLIPFPTGLYAEYPWSVTAFSVYALTIGLAGYMKAGLFRYAWSNKLVTDNTELALVLRQKARSYAVPMIASFAVLNASLFGPIFGALTFALLPFTANICEKWSGRYDFPRIISDGVGGVRRRAKHVRGRLRKPEPNAPSDSPNQNDAPATQNGHHKEKVETIGGVW